MQRRPLLMRLFIILFASLHTVAGITDCALDNGVTCTEYIVKSKPCLNLSGCMNYLTADSLADSTSVIWYRCESTRLLRKNDSSRLSCQRGEVPINAGTGSNSSPLYVTSEGRLCFRELNKTFTGLYCYKTKANSTCNPVQVVVVGRLIIQHRHS